MPVTQKLRCVVERVVAHGERVYTLALRPERPVPRFRAGQFLHLALDPYDPSGFWPESRVFSIASPPAQRDAVRITYAVHGRFTARMESDLVEGRQVWIKMPYGDFVIDSRADVALFAGGTGITAFTAFLEDLTPAERPVGHARVRRANEQPVDLSRRRGALCAAPAVARRVLFRRARRRERSAARRCDRRAECRSRPSGRGCAARSTRRYYISGPPPMLQTIGQDLRARNISPEAIHIDAWE